MLSVYQVLHFIPYIPSLSNYIITWYMLGFRQDQDSGPDPTARYVCVWASPLASLSLTWEVRIKNFHISVMARIN